jgi:hypothetical protein
MVGTTDDEIRGRISAIHGVDATDWDFLTSADQVATLRDDLFLIESCVLLPPELELGGFVFDVHSGELIPLEG